MEHISMAKFTISDQERKLLKLLENIQWKDIILLECSSKTYSSKYVSRGFIIDSEFMVSIDVSLFNDLPIDATEARLFVESNLDGDILSSPYFASDRVLEKYQSGTEELKLSAKFMNNKKEIYLCSVLDYSYSYRDDKLVPSRIDQAIIIVGDELSMMIVVNSSLQIFIFTDLSAIKENKKKFDRIERV